MRVPFNTTAKPAPMLNRSRKTKRGYPHSNATEIDTQTKALPLLRSGGYKKS
jgi:hypothetical protein